MYSNTYIENKKNNKLMVILGIVGIILFLVLIISFINQEKSLEAEKSKYITKKDNDEIQDNQKNIINTKKDSIDSKNDDTSLNQPESTDSIESNSTSQSEKPVVKQTSTQNKTSNKSQNSSSNNDRKSGVVYTATSTEKNNQKTENTKNSYTIETKEYSKTESDTTSKNNNSTTDKTNNSNKNNSSNSTTDKTNNSNKNNSSNSTTNKTNNKNQTVTKKKGWVKEGNYTYYYNSNGQKVKDAYVDYIYLDKNGRKKDKMGSFTATLYGARAWANQRLNIRLKNSSSSRKIGEVPCGGKVIILSSESNGYIKIKYGSKTGYVYADYLLINLPDVMPDLYYEITNANRNVSKAAGYNIPNVTGKNLYGYTKMKNDKIGKTTYYAPLLYPVAKQLQNAYNIAKKQGYSFKIYDTYRPRSVTLEESAALRKLYNSNSKVRKAIDYDKQRNYWGQSWFVAQNVSNHNRGIALDMTLTNLNGTEYTMQSKILTLDTSSLVKYNNKNANKLRQIMVSAGFETLESEWWHFEEKSYKSSPYNDFKIR